MNFFQVISEWAAENPGKTVGAVTGFVFGILVFTLGIIKTLLIILFVLIGILIGKSRDENISIIDQIKKIFQRD